MEILSRARKTIKSEMILNHGINSVRGKELVWLISDMDIWMDKLHKQFGDK